MNISSKLFAAYPETFDPVSEFVIFFCLGYQQIPGGSTDLGFGNPRAALRIAVFHFRLSLSGCFRRLRSPSSRLIKRTPEMPGVEYCTMNVVDQEAAKSVVLQMKRLRLARRGGPNRPSRKAPSRLFVYRNAGSGFSHRTSCPAFVRYGVFPDRLFLSPRKRYSTSALFPPVQGVSAKLAKPK